jgi:hypothetical protein
MKSISLAASLVLALLATSQLEARDYLKANGHDRVVSRRAS